MPKIKIKDLPEDVKVSEEELRKVTGGLGGGLIQPGASAPVARCGGIGGGQNRGQLQVVYCAACHSEIPGR